MKKLLIVVLGILLFASYGQAESIDISAELSLKFSVPAGWQWAQQPPEKLLEEMAEHIGHDAAAKGHSPTREQLISTARKRMQENEVLLFNPETLAHLTLDFSRIGQSEKAPSKKTIQLSTKYAGESLEQEEEVSNVKGKSQEITIKGAWYAYRYDADFLKHGEAVQFSGVTGYINPYWFFFYATNPLANKEDATKIEQIFESLEILKSGS